MNRRFAWFPGLVLFGMLLWWWVPGPKPAPNPQPSPTASDLNGADPIPAKELIRNTEELSLHFHDLLTMEDLDPPGVRLVGRDGEELASGRTLPAGLADHWDQLGAMWEYTVHSTAGDRPLRVPAGPSPWESGGEVSLPWTGGLAVRVLDFKTGEPVDSGEGKIFLPDEEVWKSIEAGSLKLPTDWIPDMSLRGKLTTYQHYHPFEWRPMNPPMDPGGRFVIEGLETSGRALFSFHEPSYGTTGDWFEVVPGEIRLVEHVVRRRPFVKVRVINEDGEPIPEATVYFGSHLDPVNKDLLQLEQGDGAGGAMAFGLPGNYRYVTYAAGKTDKDGIASRSFAPGLDYGIAAMAPDSKSYGRIEFPADHPNATGEVFDLVVHPKNQYGVTLRVVDSEGNPIPFFNCNYGIVNDPWGGRAYQIQCDADGVATILYLPELPCMIGMTSKRSPSKKWDFVDEKDFYFEIPAPHRQYTLRLTPFVESEE